MRRYMAAMINEGANVVHQGIALRPLDVDVTFLYGYGFPRYRGGPMKYADTVGLATILADIREFAKEDPRVLATLAAAGGTGRTRRGFRQSESGRLNVRLWCCTSPLTPLTQQNSIERRPLMDLNFTPEEEAFRTDVLAFLRDKLPQRLSSKVHNGHRLTRADMVGMARHPQRAGLACQSLAE